MSDSRLPRKPHTPRRQPSPSSLSDSRPPRRPHTSRREPSPSGGTSERLPRITHATTRQPSPSSVSEWLSYQLQQPAQPSVSEQSLPQTYTTQQPASSSISEKLPRKARYSAPSSTPQPSLPPTHATQQPASSSLSEHLPRKAYANQPSTPSSAPQQPLPQAHAIQQPSLSERLPRRAFTNQHSAPPSVSQQPLPQAHTTQQPALSSLSERLPRKAYADQPSIPSSQQPLPQAHTAQRPASSSLSEQLPRKAYTNQHSAPSSVSQQPLPQAHITQHPASSSPSEQLPRKAYTDQHSTPSSVSENLPREAHTSQEPTASGLPEQSPRKVHTTQQPAPSSVFGPLSRQTHTFQQPAASGLSEQLPRKAHTTQHPTPSSETDRLPPQALATQMPYECNQDNPKVHEINAGQASINSLLFTDDGKTVLGGDDKGVFRRWRVDDGCEVGKSTSVEGAGIHALALSPDRKWLVVGLKYPDGASQHVGRPHLQVWDAEAHGKVLDIDGHVQTVYSIDISPDSTKFASGSKDKLVFIWSIASGEVAIGPLQHDGIVAAVRFSPDGNRIATASEGSPSIRVYKCDNGEQLLNIPFKLLASSVSPFVWSANGYHLFAVSEGEVKRFDASSGALINKWSGIPDKPVASIALSCNQKFVVICANDSLSFWDTSTHKEIGSISKQGSRIWPFALSPDDGCVATSDYAGRVALWHLRDVLPPSYFTVNLPLMEIPDVIFRSWSQGDLDRAEELVTGEIAIPLHALHYAQALAYRALIRTRLKKWEVAIDDAKKSIEAQRTVAGHIAHALALIGHGRNMLAGRLIDLMFGACTPNESNFLLAIKAIILFESGKHDEAISRMEDLINVVDDKTLYSTIWAKMLILLGNISVRKGKKRHAIELFARARQTFPFQQNPHLVTISLMFGWDFDRLPPELPLLNSGETTPDMSDTEMLTPVSTMAETLDMDAPAGEVAANSDPGDAERQRQDPKETTAPGSTNLPLTPSDSAFFVKRSKAKAEMGAWEDALEDADEAIRADPANPWGYERKHAASHGLQRFDEAIVAFERMFSLLEGSPNEETRELANKYVSPARLHKAIDSAIIRASETSPPPHVLIDVDSGRLCDESKRVRIFKSESQCKELISSMTEKLNNGHIRTVVAECFRYVMFSHVLEDEEPTLQDIKSVKSVWNLDDLLPPNRKLRKFCEAVREGGYRWAWSDTCCIDKTNNTLLNESFAMMYQWYEASAATIVFLADVDSPAVPGSLKHSAWITWAWAGQALVASKVIRFYDSNWRPYLDDPRTNHKESPQIMQEAEGVIRISNPEGVITSFNRDKLSIREKLRLVSGRKAKVEEDIAYSLIGIFKSGIMPLYGEGYTALGHLLEDIVARSGDVTVLSWAGKSSPYNSSLPANLSVYSQGPHTLTAIEDSALDHRITSLRTILSPATAGRLHLQISHLPPARFTNRRLHLPCITFAVRGLDVQSSGGVDGMHYRAQVSGVGTIDFQTSDNLLPTNSGSQKLVFVYPWIRDLCDPSDEVDDDNDDYDDDDDDDDDKDEDDEDDGWTSESRSDLSLSSPGSISQSDNYARALRIVARLQRPFNALLLQQQRTNGEFLRVATEHDIIIPGLQDHQIKDIDTKVAVEVVEIR